MNYRPAWVSPSWGRGEWGWLTPVGGVCMAEPSVEVIGLDEVLRKLGNAASPAVLMRGMHKALNLVRRQIVTYPPASHKPMVWASEAQRRFVMAAIRSGEIEVPYRRTGDLSRAWTSEVSETGTDVVGRLGNNTVYGPYVMGKETQAAYHAGTWPVAAEVAEESMDGIVQCFVMAAEEALRG